MFAQKKTISLAYIATKGKGLETLDLRQRLQEFGDFASLPTHKLVSRLELFQTACRQKSHLKEQLTAEAFEIIEEESHEGEESLFDCSLLSSFLSVSLLTSIINGGSLHSTYRVWLHPNRYHDGTAR